jgi:hypothetical protein
MTVIARYTLALLIVGCEISAWLLLVPSVVTMPTFLLLNGLAACMLCTGIASAANGLPAQSIAELLHEVEQDETVRRYAAR